MKRIAMILMAALLIVAAAVEARNPRGSVAGSGSGPVPGTTGVWADITPSGVILNMPLSCQNFGSETVQADTTHPGTLYTHFDCQGVWKTTDYGQTWVGPINTGTNGTTVGDCAGGITIQSTGGTPTIYESCIRGAGIGFWKSTDGGVNWTNYAVTFNTSGFQDVYPPVIDPYNANHLLMAGHEQPTLGESTDGGHTWTSLTLNAGMVQANGTGSIYFINTGNSTTTASTFLWQGQADGDGVGTWRTTNDAGSWTQVDGNEHPHGSGQIYQPDLTGIVFAAGLYSSLGWGVLRSTDYGVTWAHVGIVLEETAVIGTSKNYYAMFGFPVGIGGTNDPQFELAPVPGTGTWTEEDSPPVIPSGLNQGTAQFAVMNDGTHNIIIGAMWNNGVWRYIEP